MLTTRTERNCQKFKLSFKMCLIKNPLHCLILVVFSNIHLARGVINNKPALTYNSINGGNYKTLQTGTFYLNRNRPLWILQDQKPLEMPRERKQTFNAPQQERVQYEQLKPIYFRHKPGPSFNGKRNQQHLKTKAQKRITVYNRPQLRLPNNYIPLKNHNQRSSYFNPPAPARVFPTFDSLPGEESFEKSNPVFLYTGHKGRMLFNTMLSSYKYPMQEPTPGQTLYPPPTLMIKNTSQENTFTQQPLNVTMIPFYAYEAIDPRTINNRLYTTKSSIPLSKPKRFKKAKQYAAYYAQQDIVAQPFDSTTPVPLTLEKPYFNHRQPEDEATTSLPHKKLEVTYNDGEEKFRITYEDDDESGGHLERPTEVTTREPQHRDWPYGNYENSQNYYTLPIYNVKENEKPQGVNRNSPQLVEEIQAAKEKERKTDSVGKASQSNDNTWFILNSRYKGPLKTSSKNLHSSKYIQTTRSIPDNLDFLKTTTPTTTISKGKLKPQMRAFYGDNIEIVL